LLHLPRPIYHHILCKSKSTSSPTPMIIARACASA
jgi:hypothetical protein